MKVEVGPYAVRRPARQERPARRDLRRARPRLWSVACTLDCTHWRGLSDAAIVHAGMSETEHRFSERLSMFENVTSRDLDVGPSLRTKSGSRAWGSGELHVVLNSISDRTIVQYRVCPGSPTAPPQWYAGRPRLSRPWGSVGSGSSPRSCVCVGGSGWLM